MGSATLNVNEIVLRKLHRLEYPKITKQTSRTPLDVSLFDEQREASWHARVGLYASTHR